jgi:hypothetical protein
LIGGLAAAAAFAIARPIFNDRFTPFSTWIPCEAGLYALLAGVVFLVLAGVMLALVVHHVLQRVHLEADEGHHPTARD